MKRIIFISIFVRLRNFLKHRVGLNTTVLILSFFVGIFGATAAIIVKNLVHFTVGGLNNAFPNAQVNYLYLAFPIVGIILTVLYTHRHIKDNIGHGVTIVLKSMCKSDSKLRSHNMYSSVIASTLTVGFGGSVGLEAPMVDRFRHRFQLRAALQPQCQNHHVVVGLWFNGCVGCHLQSTYHGHRLRPRSPDA